jgi:NADH:ubiquinone oxidoreductase subunit 3 (subunit A)
MLEIVVILTLTVLMSVASIVIIMLVDIINKKNKQIKIYESRLKPINPWFFLKYYFEGTDCMEDKDE